MLVLFIPWILLTICVVALLCLFKRWYWASGLLLVVALIVNWHWQVFAFGFKTLSDEKEEGVLRVMIWNVDMTVVDLLERSKAIAERILEYGNADVVFLTEYGADEGLMDSLLTSSFPYTKNFESYQSRFYSKLPIDTAFQFSDFDDHYPMTMCCRVRWNGEVVDLYGCHLASNNNVVYADSVQTKESLKLYLDNYKNQSKLRKEEIQNLKDSIGVNPTIILGDMNDVVGSPALKLLESVGMKNAWWEGGFGYGATIQHPLPYRIDHVMYGNGLNLKGIKNVGSKGLSDHDALVADFEIE